MLRLTISEAILVGILGLFAMDTARAPDSAATDRKNEYKAAIAQVARHHIMDAQYKITKEKCDALSVDAKNSCIKN